jgi:RNA recognition motif-containing protein
VFHIPNDMTNQTMYEMFAPFGNLLSVRIMVEKDTGRSRGFGFVSYDSPESAAAAIKALNGHIVSLPLICNAAILTTVLCQHFNRLLADFNFLGSIKYVFDERLVIND